MPHDTPLADKELYESNDSQVRVELDISKAITLFSGFGNGSKLETLKDPPS